MKKEDLIRWALIAVLMIAAIFSAVNGSFIKTVLMLFFAFLILKTTDKKPENDN
jgi:uncharacterized membrane protein